MKAVLTVRNLAVAATLLLSALFSPYAAATFVDNGDGTVTDSRTGLMWMRCSWGQTWSGTTCTGEAGVYPLLDFPTSSSFAGYNDWRVPAAQNELITLVDLTQPGLKIDPVAFPNMPTEFQYYWSSERDVNDTHGHHYWALDLTRGIWGDQGDEIPFRMLLVRKPISAGSFALLVSLTGTGLGAVTSVPSGIVACMSVCSAGFTADSVVTLHAIASPGVVFSGWSGACSGTVNTCTVPMSSERSVSAKFETDGSIALGLEEGWNLLGNSLTRPLSVGTVFGDPNMVTSVWKWDSAQSVWQFYSPLMDSVALQAYAQSKGYAVLIELQSGDGYWVNSRQTVTLPVIQGGLYGLAASHLKSGWNLVSTGYSSTPQLFNMSMGATQPPAGVIPINVTSLWAWDSRETKWYFYAPTLEANGSLAAYIAFKGYMDFTTSNKALTNGVGFWVNKP